MKLTEKINEYMRVFGVKSLLDFSKNAAIPYTTLKGFYVKGYNNAQRNTLIKLKNYMGITLGELADDNVKVDFEVLKNKAYINGDIDTGDNVVISIGRGGKRSIYKLDEADSKLVDNFLNRLIKKN